MNGTTLDFDDYISSKKEKDAEFAKEFDSGYEDFKIGMMIKEMRLENGMTKSNLRKNFPQRRASFQDLKIILKM